MTDRAYIVSRTLEHKIAIAENNNQNTLIVTLDVLKEILALLKEQEPVKPIFIANPYTHLPVSYCPQCREPINEYIVGNPYKMTKCCHYCGKAVKWE